jgi:hypothetical protein
VSPDEEATLTELLLDLEKQLMDSAFRKDREQVSVLLAENFCEFGSSGRVWSREATLDLLANEPPQPAPIVEDFAIRLLSPETALVTYRTLRRAQNIDSLVSLRSSIWVRGTQSSRGDWQVLFHQGTKVPLA